MPPAGGFEPVKYKRNLPTRGPGGAVVFGAVAAICAFGFWRVGLGNLEKRCVSFVGGGRAQTHGHAVYTSMAVASRRQCVEHVEPALTDTPGQPIEQGTAT